MDSGCSFGIGSADEDHIFMRILVSLIRVTLPGLCVLIPKKGIHTYKHKLHVCICLCMYIYVYICIYIGVSKSWSTVVMQINNTMINK